MTPKPDSLPFVGREAELEKFREMLDSRDAPWLMWVIGPAGQGKSKFLEACLSECKQQKIIHSGIIDFFNDGMRTRWGVIKELARTFRVENNTEFRSAFDQYQSEVSKGNLADPDVLQFALNQSEDALIKAILPKRLSKPRVIFVDTVEEVINNLGSWFFEKFVTKLYPHFRVVAGGRKVPSVGGDPSFWRGHQPYYCKLSGFSIDNIRQYLQEDGLLTDEMKPHLKKLHQLTSKDGQALLLALACLALKEKRFSPQDFTTITESKFMKELIIDPHSEGTVENFIILELAHAYHGYTSTTLRLMHSLDELDTKTFKGFLEKLMRFPYVKFHPDTDTTRLHDYFRERLSKGLWIDVDPDLSSRTGISRKLANYFENQIQNYEKINKNESPDLDTLRHRWLYHLLFANRERAYGELWDLLDISWHAFKFDYMDSLLDMAQEVNNILSGVGKFDKILNSLEKSARAWMGLEVWKTERALDLANQVLEDSGGVRRFKLTAMVAKATALGRLGNFDESIKILRKAYQGYEDLLQIAHKAENGDKAAQKDLLSEHGVATVHGIKPERYLILNTVGVLLRNRGHFDDALKEFEKSFEMSRAEDNKTWKASAATQAGNVLRYKGNYNDAYNRIHQGLNLRRQIRQRGQEAYSIQALGMLQRDQGNLSGARRSLFQAYEIWRELHNEFDMASAARNLGWVDYLDYKYESAESYYTEAEKYYERMNLSREFPNLRQKQGELYIAKAGVSKVDRDRNQYLKKAKKYLLEGVRLGDIYRQSLYTTLCLVELCRITQMVGDYKTFKKYEVRLRKYESDGFRYDLAYADLEEILGKIAQDKAMKGTKVNHQFFDEAVDHICQMFVYLIGFSPDRYRRRLQFLREWLPSLPDELRHRASKHLIECWENHPGLAKNYHDFIETVKAMDEL